MRLLCELLIVGVVIYFGWKEPLSQQIPWHKTAAPVASAVTSNHAASRRPDTTSAKQPSTSVDRPAYNGSRSFTGHILYVDEAGKKYWLDVQGQRHYQP